MNPASLLLLVCLMALVVFCFRRRSWALSIWSVIVVGLFALTGGSSSFLIIGLILGSLLLGQPLFVLMGVLSMVSLALVTEYDSLSSLLLQLDTIIEKLLELASKEVLLAIPFFVVAGEVMTQGSLAQRLIDVAKACFGWLPGGLAVAGVSGCIFFAAISGSSPVTVIAIGSIMVPALLRAKYPEPFSIGLLTTAGSLGILIPPSIPMIVYSIMVGATTPMDPKDLFLGGVLPGALIGGMLATYSIFIGYRHQLQTATVSLGQIFAECKRGFWSLLLPVIILGGIYTGIFTATEAAAVSVVYALVVELFIHGELKPRNLMSVAENSMTVMGALFLIIALAIGLNHVLVLEQVPERMVEWLQSLELNRTTFLIIVNLFLLMVGMFMDIMSAILIIAPMLAPMSAAMGIDPIHMGIVFIVNLEIGYLTPPVGLNLFVASTLFRKDLGEIIRAVMAPLLIMMLGLMAITWFPQLSTGLGRALAGKPIFDVEEPPPTDRPPSPAGHAVAPLSTHTDAGPAGVKTLAELMAEANADDAADGGPASAPPAAGRVKTLAELMAEANADDAADAAADGGAP